MTGRAAAPLPSRSLSAKCSSSGSAKVRVERRQLNPFFKYWTSPGEEKSMLVVITSVKALKTRLAG